MRFSPPARIGTVVPGRRRNFEANVLRIVAALTIAVVAASCTRKEAPAVSEQKRALNVAPAIGNFAVYGDNSVVIRDRVQIAGGDVGVRKKGTTGPFLVAGYELAITSDAKVEASRSVIGGRVLLQDRAVVGDVQTTQLTNQSGSYSGLYPQPFQGEESGGTRVWVKGDW